MASFHEEMIEARRRGELYLPDQPASEPAEAPEKSSATLPTYTPVDAAAGLPYECSECGALVTADGASRHSAFHARVDS